MERILDVTEKVKPVARNKRAVCRAIACRYYITRLSAVPIRCWCYAVELTECFCKIAHIHKSA